MRRSSRVVLWYLAVLAVSVAVLQRWSLQDGIIHRAPLHHHFGAIVREGEAARHARAERLGPAALDVALFGDSIFWKSAPDLEAALRRRLPAADPRVDSFVFFGSGYAQHVLLNERILDGTVDVAIMTLNSRHLSPFDSLNRNVEVASLVTPRSLLGMMQLPWERLGVDRRRLWASQLLRIPAVDLAADWYDELKQTGGVLLGRLADALDFHAGYERRDNLVGRVQADIRRSFDPATWDAERVPPFVEHAVRRQLASGVIPLIVIDPLPRFWGPLQEAGAFERAVATLAAIKQRIEQNGGHVLDLHALLTKEQFADDQGHFTAEGRALVVDAIATEVVRLVDTRVAPPRGVE